MLENEADPATGPEGPEDSRPTVTTTRRRVASRPAGPPPDSDDGASGTPAKKPARARKTTRAAATETATPEVKVVKTTRRRAATRAAAPPPEVEETASGAAAEPTAVEPTAQAPAASAPEAEAGAGRGAAKAKGTRRARTSAAAADEASAEAGAPAEKDETSEPAVKVVKTTRRRAATRAAAPPPEVEETAGEPTAATAAPAEAPAEDEGAAKRTRTRRRPARAAEAPAEETAPEAVSVSEPASEAAAEAAPAEEAAPRSSRTRSRKRAAATDEAAFSSAVPQVPAVPGAEPEVDENEPASSVGVPGVTFQPPTMVVFQPPQPTAAKPARKRAQEEERPADEAEPETEERAEAAPGEEQDEDDRPSRRRRRRGGRGRGRGREGAEDEGAEGEEEAEAAESAKETAKPAAAEEQAEDEGDEDEGEGGPGSSRRRRRRRRRSGGGDEATVTDDPPNTVVHVREVREQAPRPVEDEVQAVRGSTRLEAKKQRRREGREQGRRRPPVITEAEFLARRESVKREMVVRQEGDRTQIAVLEDDVLVEHYINRASHQSYVGNVYLGKVQNVLPSMEAAFVDIGKGRNAVLYAGEVNWDTAGLEGQPRRIESALKSGQSVLVQVTKDPLGHKGARLTSQVSLPGRYLVYVPDGSMTGISRKLPDKERSRLKQILKKVMPENAGVIVRTAAEGATEEELARDVSRLAAQWEHIQKQVKSASAPSLLHGEPDLTIRVIRDIFNEDFGKLVVQGDGAWDTVSEYVGYVAPHLADRVEKWTGDGDVMGAFRIDEQIAKALDRKVWLPSGGSLVIDRTEAMTVIDVNTGKFTGQGGNLEETVTRNNLEAAEEIVRQLRLRDIGGIVVIDFIDMVLESNRDLVLRRLVECLSRDRTKHQVAEVTSLGLVQMTRKRVGQGLLEAFSETCESCNGRGIHVHLTPVEPSKAVEKGAAKETGRRRKRKGDVERAVEEKLAKSTKKEDEEPPAQAAVEAAEAAEETEGTSPGALTDEAPEASAASSNGRTRRRTRRATRPASAPPEPANAE
ncbi:Rne/Rng family ribonuclease [Actinomadura oligospora]|uniref:Rne/Rng family ribonuclease n=1 Tax=Actinomadura oligospora TaxID=111804 RepID=UPI0004BCB20C|nr:Rne/Rng family ribonuclease [Actinomadura oligospora]